MRAKRSAVALAVFVSLAAPVGAAGHAKHHHRTPLAVALGKAVGLWHAAPCDGHYRVRLVHIIDGDVGIGGQADFDTPTGRGFYTSPPSTWTRCEMLLRAVSWSRENTEANWPQLCTEVLHEAGHLTGHVHTDPTDREVAEGASYGWTYGNAPGVPVDTPEQAAVMRSGNKSYSSDVARCGTQL